MSGRIQVRRRHENAHGPWYRSKQRRFDRHRYRRPSHGGPSQYFGPGTKVFLPRGYCRADQRSIKVGRLDRPPGPVRLLVNMNTAKALALLSSPRAGIVAMRQ
jgi:hypothetical protein